MNGRRELVKSVVLAALVALSLALLLVRWRGV